MRAGGYSGGGFAVAAVGVRGVAIVGEADS